MRAFRVDECFAMASDHSFSFRGHLKRVSIAVETKLRCLIPALLNWTSFRLRTMMHTG